MSVEESIQIGSEPSGGKKLRALKNTVGGVDVHSEVTAVQDGLGNVVDPRNIRPLTTDDKVSVEVESMPAVTGSVAVSSLPAVTGEVTANAGSNLNTSALALESGGKLAAAEANLALLVKALESLSTDALLTKQLDIDMLLRTLLNTALARTTISSTGLLRVSDDNKSQNYLTSGANNPTAGAPTIGSGNWLFVWCGPVDQRWEIIQRSNIEYNETQRSKFTFT